MNTTSSNLTTTQQDIINSIVAEFETFNKPMDTGNEDDLIAFIENSINEKQRFRDEILITNKAYNQANTQKVFDIIDQMNQILNRFGYCAEFGYGSDSGGHGYNQYYSVKIMWNGHLNDHRNTETTDVFFYANDSLQYRLWYLVDSTLRIYKGYARQNEIYSVESLLKYVAELIIEKKKSLIK